MDRKNTNETNCDFCAYYNIDEDTGMYICHMNLDEDEMVRYLTGSFKACPYFKLYDEYAIVRKQN